MPLSKSFLASVFRFLKRLTHPLPSLKEEGESLRLSEGQVQ